MKLKNGGFWMLCQDVRRVVYFFLDDALGEQKKQDLAVHVRLCPSCEQRVEVQQKLRNAVRAKLQPVHAPDRLRNRLSRSLRAFQTEWTQ